MYTLLKALTALQLARRTEREQNVPAVAIFWVEAEDHDWEEVRKLYGARRRVRAAHRDAGRISRAPGSCPSPSSSWTPASSRRIDELAAVLQQTEFTAGVLDSIRAAWHPGRGLACAFATWIETLLGPHGLVVFESADPAAKPLVADVFARELLAPGRTAELAAQAGETLASRGHAPQVVPQPDSVSLFSLDPRPPIDPPPGRPARDRRQPALARGAVARSAGAPRGVQPERAAAADRPGHALPHHLLRRRSERARVSRPAARRLRAVRRADAADVSAHDGDAARFRRDAVPRRSTRCPIEDLRTPDESALNKLLESQLPASVEQSLRDAATQTQQAMARVIDALPALDPTLAGAARTTLGKMEHELRSLHSKVIHAAKKRDETLRRQFTRAQAQAFPHGHPQERTLGVVYFLNKYGPGVVDLLLDELPAGSRPALARHAVGFWPLGPGLGWKREPPPKPKA